MKYNKKFQEILVRLEAIDDEECQSLQKEIQVLADLYTKKDTRLNKIIKQSDKQQRAILELNEELDIYKNNLEKKVQEEISKRKNQEDLLYEQSRLAAMAEMIDAVAHQWIQPLNIIWMQTELLYMEANKNNGLTPHRVGEFKANSSKQINHLIDTLKNFRTFFRPVKEKTLFSVKNAVRSVVSLIQEDLLKYSITLELHIDESFTIKGNENEFRHILINLINNSKYAFLKNKNKDRKIIIKIIKEEQKLEYIDNAGGIKEEMLDNLFKMHTSTKGDDGTGIGLYMSQQIAHKHNGELFAENIHNGAKFTFIYKG